MIVTLIVKIILPSLLLTSGSAADKAQNLVHLRFNSTFQLINGTSSNLQKLLKYFDGAAIVASFKISLFPSATVFFNNSALYMKDSKLLPLAISALKLVASSFV